MGKSGYYIGLVLQIFSTLLYFLLAAALINDAIYLYDNQMFYGAERVIYVGFIKQFIPLTLVYIVLIFIGHAFKSPYKRLKKKTKRESLKKHDIKSRSYKNSQ